MRCTLNRLISPKSKLALRRNVPLYKAILRPIMLVHGTFLFRICRNLGGHLKFLLIVDGLQTFDVLPSSTGNFLLIVDGLQTFDVLPSSTGNFLLIVDGLQTFDVLPSSTGDSSTHRGRTADLLMCCPAGVTNFLRSIDASAIFLVGTHMIAELSSRDGTFSFSFLLVVIFLCCVFEGGEE
ncbi:integrase_H2C2 domain-containing protein [Trichonephila clavipes]|uniref:Integrase_H2C2 domain-containing protein n=1 Tax=Trichonephila clavipes TaxID=2585209 RepID=A0A8X6VYX0_TRICX|nr:integrase_H2C2 domain-containing protein [Trichonephila clavipes]